MVAVAEGFSLGEAEEGLGLLEELSLLLLGVAEGLPSLDFELPPPAPASRFMKFEECENPAVATVCAT